LSTSSDTLACNFTPITVTSFVNTPDVYAYKWTPTNETISKIVVPTVLETTKTHTITATNLSGCTKNDFVTVSISPNFYTQNPVASQTNVCLKNVLTLSSGLAATLPNTVVTSLPSGIIYSWSSNNNLYPNQANIAWNTTLVGQNVVTITALTPEGCKLKNMLTITGSKQTVIIKPQKDSVCIGQSVHLNATTTGAFRRACRITVL